MRKTPLNALNAFLICLIASSCASCREFKWEARPYVGDSKNSQIMNRESEVIRCDEPRFDEMTCFDAENIAELKTAIDQVNNKKLRKKLQKSFNKALIK